MQFESRNSLVFVAIVKRYAESGSASSRCEGFVTVVYSAVRFSKSKVSQSGTNDSLDKFLVYSGCAYYAS
jgi:hypothetical protein